MSHDGIDARPDAAVPQRRLVFNGAIEHGPSQETLPGRASHRWQNVCPAIDALRNIPMLHVPPLSADPLLPLLRPSRGAGML